MPSVMDDLQAEGFTIREVVRDMEYWVGVPNDQEYNVFQGSDDGSDPDGWYVEVGGVIDGPYDSFDDLVCDMFLVD